MVRLLPLVDSLPVQSGRTDEFQEIIQRIGHFMAAAERVDELCVVGRHAPSIGAFLRFVKSEFLEDDLQATELQNCQMAQKVKKTRDVETGDRLRLVRQALGFTSKRAFVDHMMAPTDEDDLRKRENLYSKWENGWHLVPPDFLEQLKRRYSVTLDYIYLGDMAGLPADLRDRIISAERHAKAH